MSSDHEKEYKELKQQYGIETSTEEESSTYDVESENSSYVFISEDDLLSNESEDDEGIQNYFSSSSTEVESDKSEVAWEDSDDNENARDLMEDDATWLTEDGFQKKIKTEAKKISFKLKRTVFTANCKVKLLKIFPNFKIVVDSFNLIYLLRNFEDFETFKIDFFKICDICFFGGKILFSSISSSYIKQMTLEGKVADVKKGTGNVKKMIATSDFLFILGEKLFVFNQNFSLISTFNSAFTDFCIGSDSVVCLKEDGDVYVFDFSLNFQQKISFSFKFQFKSIYHANDMFFIGTVNGLMILDKSFKEIKTTSNLQEPVTSLISNGEFIVHGSSYENSLRILKVKDMRYFEKFPFSKIDISPISTIASEGDTFYFSDSRYISSLQLTYI